jgi:hypothetical protein
MPESNSEFILTVVNNTALFYYYYSHSKPADPHDARHALVPADSERRLLPHDTLRARRALRELLAAPKPFSQTTLPFVPGPPPRRTSPPSARCG